MPDAAGKFRGISVPNLPWHNSDADAILPASPEPEEAVVYVDEVQELAAVLVGRNVMRVYRDNGENAGLIVIETGECQVHFFVDGLKYEEGEVAFTVTEL